MINIPKGTKDMLPAEAVYWHYIEDAVKAVASIFGFKEIRTPVFEHTELFLRGVGSTTDIVNKEMYTFEDKGGRSVTLKPEGTAGVARAYIENLQGNSTLPLKLYYLTPVFRYERPQSGRLREHHQFGVELFGSSSYLADAEVISLAKRIFDELSLENIRLKINSIGCKECRAKYNEELKAYLEKNLADMCAQCGARLKTNPLRILDCKEPQCKKICDGAPVVLDYLCPDCKAHFEGVKSALENFGIDFTVDPKIVRGLDYYTRTVFEFVTDSIGAQGTVCGGGRYDNLVAEIGGNPVPAVGFGMGLERLLLVLQNEKLLDGISEIGTGFYVAPVGENAAALAVGLVSRLRAAGYSAEFDLMKKSLKAQMKYADKIGASFVIVLGDDEIASGEVTVKDMKGETSFKVALDGFLENLENALDELYHEEGECGCGENCGCSHHNE
jgi:histidyl-tRNA synthetase